MVKERMWSDGKEFYTKAIAVLTDKSQDRWEEVEDSELEARETTQLVEQCYTNRALCNLELSMSFLLELSFV